MSRAWQGNFFEDFELGASVQCPTPRTLTHGDAATYLALTGDRTPGYCGPAGAAHPLVVFHAVFGQTVRSISLNARANLGYAGIRWHRPVPYGSTLRTRYEVVGLKENSSGETGIVWVRTTGVDENDRVVLTFWRWVMINKRDAAPTRWADDPVVPDLPSRVEPTELVAVGPSDIPAEDSGARWVFDDYQPGERIFHGDAMAVNASDHMSFTRLFQNSARVHFDAAGMNGRPLVYGGVVISLGYALAFNGLEGRVGICAINGGTHANPTHAGDTLYACSDVLEVAPVNDELGALRLRLIVTRDADPSADPAFAAQIPDPRRPGRTKYRPDVVLDLDYWELVRR